MKKVILLLLLVSSQSFAFSKAKSMKLLTLGGRIGGGSGYSKYSELPAGSCANVPLQVKKAFNEAVQFTRSCRHAQISSQKHIAINDHSGKSRPSMYIFDLQGNCVKSVNISWGMGSPRRDSLDLCSTDGSHQTPPGFHVTTRYSGEKYNNSNSLGLAGMSGQNSLSRGILIHGKWYAAAANTYGCTGVPDSDFKEIQNILGVGSLVYNYSGNRSQGSCSDSSGLTPTCEPEDAGQRAVISSGGGKGPPAAKLFELDEPPSRMEKMPQVVDDTKKQAPKQEVKQAPQGEHRSEDGSEEEGDGVQ